MFGKGWANYLSLNPGSAPFLAVFLAVFSTEPVTVLVPTSWSWKD